MSRPSTIGPHATRGFRRFLLAVPKGQQHLGRGLRAQARQHLGWIRAPHSRGESAPSASASASVGHRVDAYPLWMIARLKYPALPGETTCRLTLWPPADCPAMARLFGSPPNAAILSRTQASAAR